MANVTYLLGAGASANEIPIVNKIPEGIADIIARIEKIITHVDDHVFFQDSCRTGFNTIKEDLLELLKGCQNHASIDTYAKKLFLTKQRTKYRITKCSIILFFELYSYFYKEKDKRYDSFLASILNNDVSEFPKNIKILSWNYDYELEKAYDEYMHFEKPVSGWFSRIIPSIHKNQPRIDSLDTFGIIKINGTVGYYEQDDDEMFIGLGLYNFFSTDNVEDDHKILSSELMENYLKLRDSKQICKPRLFFSWDEDTTNRKVDSEIVKTMSKTDVLVIVGYSFPFFNRTTDKLIFDSFRPRIENNRKIYIQDMNANNIKETLLGLGEHLSKIDIVPIIGVDQFYMPHEL